MQRIIALIPARSGSKRVRDKNIRQLGEHPLIGWSIITARRLVGVSEIVVSTDSEEYARIAEDYGAIALIRPPDLASDDTGDHPVIKHFLQHFPTDLVIYLRPTTPFRSVAKIEEAIGTLIYAGDYATSLRSIEEMGESAWKCFHLRYGYLVPLRGDMGAANLPNHLVTKTYRGNGYVDIIKSKQVSDPASGPEGGAITDNLWGDRCIGFVTPRAIEIDTEDDLRFAEFSLKRKEGEG